MKNKKFVATFNLLLVIVCLCAQAYALFNSDDTLEIIAAVVNVLALLYAMLYAFGEYKKSSAINYKIFFILFSLAEVVSIGKFLVQGSSLGDKFEALKVTMPLIGVITEILCVIIPAFCLVGIALIATNKNLGKELSKNIALTILCSYTACFVLSFIVADGLFSIILFGKAVLSCITYIMVYEKYVDKDARGTI